MTEYALIAALIALALVAAATAMGDAADELTQRAGCAADRAKLCVIVKDDAR